MFDGMTDAWAAFRDWVAETHPEVTIPLETPSPEEVTQMLREHPELRRDMAKARPEFEDDPEVFPGFIEMGVWEGWMDAEEAFRIILQDAEDPANAIVDLGWVDLARIETMEHILSSPGDRAWAIYRMASQSRWHFGSARTHIRTAPGNRAKAAAFAMLDGWWDRDDALAVMKADPTNLPDVVFDLALDGRWNLAEALALLAEAGRPDLMHKLTEYEPFPAVSPPVRWKPGELFYRE